MEKSNQLIKLSLLAEKALDSKNKPLKFCGHDIQSFEAASKDGLLAFLYHRAVDIATFGEISETLKGFEFAEEHKDNPTMAGVRLIQTVPDDEIDIVKLSFFILDAVDLANNLSPDKRFIELSTLNDPFSPDIVNKLTKFNAGITDDHSAIPR